MDQKKYLFVFAITLVFIKFSHQYINDKFKYDKFPEIDGDEEAKRVISALKINKKPQTINLGKNQLTRKELKMFIGDINAALLHYSGNCALLATVFMYNCLNPHDMFLAAKNTYPITEGIIEDVVQKFLLGQKLTPYYKGLKTLDGLEDKILDCYKKTGEKVFLVSAWGYSVPIIGETGHYFNAIIQTNESQKISIQFVDAWRSSNPLPSKKDLEEKYSKKSASYEILYCKDKKLIKNFSKTLSKNLHKKLNLFKLGRFSENQESFKPNVNHLKNS